MKNKQPLVNQLIGEVGKVARKGGRGAIKGAKKLIGYTDFPNKQELDNARDKLKEKNQSLIDYIKGKDLKDKDYFDNYLKQLGIDKSKLVEKFKGDTKEEDALKAYIDKICKEKKARTNDTTTDLEESYSKIGSGEHQKLVWEPYKYQDEGFRKIHLRVLRDNSENIIEMKCKPKNADDHGLMVKEFVKNTHDVTNCTQSIPANLKGDKQKQNEYLQKGNIEFMKHPLGFVQQPNDINLDKDTQKQVDLLEGRRDAREKVIAAEQAFDEAVDGLSSLGENGEIDNVKQKIIDAAKELNASNRKFQAEHSEINAYLKGEGTKIADFNEVTKEKIDKILQGEDVPSKIENLKELRGEGLKERANNSFREVSEKAELQDTGGKKALGKAAKYKAGKFGVGAESPAREVFPIKHTVDSSLETLQDRMSVLYSRMVRPKPREKEEMEAQDERLEKGSENPGKSMLAAYAREKATGAKQVLEGMRTAVEEKLSPLSAATLLRRPSPPRGAAAAAPAPKPGASNSKDPDKEEDSDQSSSPSFKGPRTSFRGV